MKRIFKLAVLTLTLGLFSHAMNGQTLTESGNKPDAVAKAELAQLDKELNLSDEQERTLFRAIVKREVEYRKSVKGKDPNNPNVAHVSKKLEENFNTSMKETLTEKQYKKWLRTQ